MNSNLEHYEQIEADLKACRSQSMQQQMYETVALHLFHLEGKTTEEIHLLSGRIAPIASWLYSQHFTPLTIARFANEWDRRNPRILPPADLRIFIDTFLEWIEASND